MPKGVLDHETLEAVGVLARAVESERVPGVLECRLLVNALRRTIASRQERELNEASRVFRTLDSELRARIVARAKVEAKAKVSAPGEANAATPAGPAPDAKAHAGKPMAKPGGKAAAGSSFLAALNGLRPGRSGSRSAAKDRLRAAVDTQRGLTTRKEPSLGD